MRRAALVLQAKRPGRARARLGLGGPPPAMRSEPRERLPLKADMLALAAVLTEHSRNPLHVTYARQGAAAAEQSQ